MGITSGRPITTLMTGCDSVSVGKRIGDVHCVRRVLSLFPVRVCGRGHVHHFRVTCMTRDCCKSRLALFVSSTNRNICSIRIGGGNDRIIYHSGIVFARGWVGLSALTWTAGGGWGGG